MHFVYDEYLETAVGGKVLDVLPQFADIVHAGIGSAVDLEHVHRIADGYLLAGRADVTRFRGRPTLAIQGFGQYSGSAGFPYSACAGKQEGMGYTPGINGVFQCLADVLLAYQGAKGLRAPFSS